QRNTSGGTLTLDAGTRLKIGGDSTFPSNFSSHSLHSSSVVEYYGGSQNIARLHSVAGYPSLVLSGTGIKTLGGNVAVANNLTVNSATGLTVASGQSLTVGNNLVNNGGTVLIENNANLMQNAATTANTNTGEVMVKRDGSPLYRLDYTMWSAPTATTQTMAQFSPHTSLTRFYTYNPVTDFYETIPSSSTFAAGHGYLIRMPNGDPAPGYVEGTTQITFHGAFTGKPNNGTYTRTLANLGAGYHPVGNPYPSTIEVAKFLAANENAIAGTIWIWRKKNNDDSPNSAYITVNRAGIYVGNNEPNTSTNPNGIINTGQGFLVKLKSLAAPASISFTNAMRNASTSSQFYRMNGGQESPAESHGVWLNLTSESGKFSQMYSGYIDGATNGIDSDLDSEYINDAPTVLASVIDNKEFVIQGRALPFSSSDVVRLLFKTDVAGDYKIAIDHVDGLFSGSQEVFLNDNLMGITHNLKETAYNFSTETGSFDSRFEIVYNTTALSNEHPAITSDKVIVYQNDNSISIASATATIKAITVFDMQGRKIYSRQDVNASDAVVAGLTAKNQPLIITIQTVNGTVSKKIIF
ncbi:MAG: T9SS type A sorting domain-containing protein, partial [Flavobacterium sp.]